MVDALAVNVAIVLAFLLRFGWPPPEFNFSAYENVFVPLTIGQLLIFFVVELYEPSAERSGPSLLGAVAKGTALGMLALVALSFFFRAFSFPRSVVAFSFLLQLLLIWGWRRVAAGLLHVRWPERRVVVVGCGDDISAVVERLRASERWGYRVVAVVGEQDGVAAAGLPLHVGLDALPTLVESLRPDQIIVSAPARHRRVLEEVALSRRFDGEILVVPHVYEMHLGELDFSLLGDLPLLRLTRSSRPLWREQLKEWVERGVAVFLLLVLSPLLLLIALAVVVFSGKPLVYRQERVGRAGATFTLYKFRTMVPDAEQEGAVLAEEHDPRVTGVGRVLRSSRLDELPQLVNVAQGDMSFVGPRPERPEFVREFSVADPLFAERLRVRPGITGLAQVSGSYATTPSVKLRFDLMYIYHQSLALDLRIVLRTLQVILTGRGAR